MKTLRSTLSPLSRAIAACVKNVIRQRDEMHEYQDTGTAFIKDTPFCALFIDLGMGKTIITFTALLDLMVQGKMRKTLIVAPKRVANVGWTTEASEWGHTCFYHIEVIKGDQGERKRSLDVDCHFYTIGIDNLGWLIDHYKGKWPFDVVVLDESSKFKSHTSKRFKALKKVRRYLKRMIQLTATPAAEGYRGIFAQINLLDDGERFGNTISSFDENYFTQNKYTFKWKIRPGAEEEILRKISDICLVMKAEDYLDLEKPVCIPVDVPLDEYATEKYLYLEENSILEILPPDFDENIDDPVIIEAEQAASLQSKLLQIASGFVYDTKIIGVTDDDKVIKQKDAYFIHEAKFDMLQEMIEGELEGLNVLLGYHFKPTLEVLKRRFPQMKVMDDEGKLIKPWNDGKIPLLAAHPQSAAHGLNLQKGGHVIIYVDHPWSLENFLQFNGRLARQGQTHLVTVYQLRAVLSSGAATWDADQIQALVDKEDIQEAFFRLLNRLKGKYSRKKKKGAEVFDDED